MLIYKLENINIFEQLQMEEALLRTHSDDICIINSGSKESIVMGVSTKPHEVIDGNYYKTKPIPIIRRFSGGGTVVIEPSTLLITFIVNHTSLTIDPFPKEVLKWTEQIYKPLFSSLPFSVKENDYAIENRKCGGNAQYFSKGRFLHHTSFLWEYTPENMNYLLMPPRMPSYRENRSHQDFLCSLKPHFQNKNEFIDSFLDQLSNYFCLSTKSLPVLTKYHRKSTQEVKFIEN